mmetsp:Transcript_53123/g.124438  ORF Transcript_53123/g.124438 Transcript_53123/m.124438 type:complete len:214 (-) Transcript_53123:57-698(-)
MNLPPVKSESGDKSTEIVSSEPSSLCSGSRTDPPVVYAWYSRLRTLTLRQRVSPHASYFIAALSNLSSIPLISGNSSYRLATPCRCSTRCSTKLCMASSMAEWKVRASSPLPSGKSKSDNAASSLPVGCLTRTAFPTVSTMSVSAAVRTPCRRSGDVASASDRMKQSGSISCACHSSTLHLYGGTTKTPHLEWSLQTDQPSVFVSANTPAGSA